jgi:hypothetical protein
MKTMMLMVKINYGNTNDNIRGDNNGDMVDKQRHSLADAVPTSYSGDHGFNSRARVRLS